MYGVGYGIGTKYEYTVLSLGIKGFWQIKSYGLMVVSIYTVRMKFTTIIPQ